MMSSAFSVQSLSAFTGTEEWYKHFLNRHLIYTEGIFYLAEAAKCRWLLDDIALKYFRVLLKKFRDHFYLIEFVASSDDKGHITISDGNGKVHLTDTIRYTDFPVKNEPIKFYLVETDGRYCLMLQSEY